MTHDFGFRLALEMGHHFGLPTDRWPASAGPTASFFTIVVNVLEDQERAAQWFEAARRAHHQAASAATVGSYQFSFHDLLEMELDNMRRGPELVFRAAWAALTAPYGFVRGDGVDTWDVYLDCAARACRRSTDRRGVTTSIVEPAP
ncbi:hypothetical protein [Streptomyces benahoarensis]|uniref:Uncharacterized protein n=1 Tax=Streptomyces benahoarensis TaxID=2595054 RepID=A0A553ZQ93_9ACTN|nr:hypothetical protein [Streptomyces benahoarensis]TSB32085.1 hypothetical protein FNJ62_03410 [Streptomyces benahoarensis]TSB43622.1 hypothetical protein FNZ23_03460 [Streptomyces benahoarensis]